MKAERQQKESQQINPVQSKCERSRLSFVDNRLQIVNQTKLVNLIQRETDIRYGELTPDGCGTQVHAFLDPDDMKEGKSPPSSRPPWWPSLKSISPTIANFVERYLVQGHLLNHHVGGPDKMENLTPITASANSTMETYFESKVKKYFNSENKGKYDLFYVIKAHYHNEAPPTAEEICGSKLDFDSKEKLNSSGLLNRFCDWISAEYTAYEHGSNKAVESPNGYWVKNENSELRGVYENKPEEDPIGISVELGFGYTEDEPLMIDVHFSYTDFKEWRTRVDQLAEELTGHPIEYVDYPFMDEFEHKVSPENFVEKYKDDLIRHFGLNDTFYKIESAD